jgi:hypothetical protein
MNKFIISLFLVLFLFSTKIQAQEEEKISYSLEENKGLYLGAIGSTNGWGGEIKYLFNKRFTLRSGYETLNFTYVFDFDENEVEYDATMDYKTGGVFLLGDFNYTRNLYISAGVVFNNFNPVMTGYAVGDVPYGDITIPAEMVGDFTFTFSPELQVSPYASLGARAFIGKAKRVNLGAELGCYYMGAPQIDIAATGLIAPTADPAHGQEEKLENQISQYKFYPVFKLNLSVQLF